MRRRSTGPWLLIVALASVYACRSGTRSTPAAATSSSASQSMAKLRLGAPLGQSRFVPLTEIADDVPKYAAALVQTEGVVTAVCQAMGCWMEIADASGAAHVRMSGHSFFIPKSATGRRARIEAKVLPRPDQGQCEKEAEQATGKTVELELEATGVELQ